MRTRKIVSVVLFATALAAGIAAYGSMNVDKDKMEQIFAPNDTMSDGKMFDGKMSNSKIEDGKMSDDKTSDSPTSGGMSDGKTSDNKIPAAPSTSAMPGNK